jgi:hypothetical protein
MARAGTRRRRPLPCRVSSLLSHQLCPPTAGQSHLKRRRRSRARWPLDAKRSGLTRPLCSGRITGLHRSYGSVRPSVPHRYARLAVNAACASPLASERLVPAVPHESPDQVHAPYTPVAGHPVAKYPADRSQKIETPLVSTTNLWIKTRQRRFTFVRLSDPRLHEV